jgi:hypothetical protein
MPTEHQPSAAAQAPCIPHPAGCTALRAAPQLQAGRQAGTGGGGRGAAANRQQVQMLTGRHARANVDRPACAN